MSDNEKIIINVDKEKSHKKKHKKCDDKKIIVKVEKEESSSSSSSSSDSDKCDKNINIKINKKECSDSDGNNKKCRRRHDKDSSSSSDSDCEKRKNRNKHNKHQRNRSDSDCKPKKWCKKNDSCSDDYSSCSSDNDEDNCKNYCKYKKYLLKDHDLMLAGSDAFISLYSHDEQVVKLSSPILFEHDISAVNVLHIPGRPAIVIQRDGVYLFYLAIHTLEGNQFTICVNSIPNFTTTVGSNAGAGQSVSEHILALKKDDVVTIRNYQSAIGTVTIPQVVGGALESANVECKMIKIAPYPNCHNHYDNWCKSLCWDKKKCKENCENKYSDSSDTSNWSGWESRCDHIYDSDCGHKKHKTPKKLLCFFKKLEKLLCKDCDLLLKGSDCFASIYSDVDQTVALESPVIYNKTKILNNATANLALGEIVINKSGYFDVSFVSGPKQASQITVFVNGNPIVASTTGTNKGANQLHLNIILSLKSGDVISIRNHTSLVGAVDFGSDAGGLISGVSASFLLFKIANLNVDCVYPPWWKRNCYKIRRLELFKKYLRCRKCYVPDGAIYSELQRSTKIDINLEEAIPYAVFMPNGLRGIFHKGIDTEATICKSGVYSLYVNTNTAAPAQFTLFVNGNPEIGTSDGTDSGAGQCSIRQLVSLKKGDVVKVVNHKSFLNPVTLTENAGGVLIGNNSIFVLVRIAPWYCMKKKCDK